MTSACSESDGNVRAAYATVKQYLVLKGSSKSQEELHALGQAVLSLTWQDDAAKLRNAAVGDISAARVDAVIRMLSLTHRVAEIEAMPNLEITEGVTEKLRAFHKELLAMEGYIKAQRSRFSEVNAGWWADVLVCETCSGVGGRTFEHARKQWFAGVAALTAKMDQVAPSATFVQNSKLLASPEMQQTLFDNPHKAELATLVEDLSLAIKLAKTLQSQQIPIAEDVVSAAKSAKTHGKACVGLEWGLRKLLREAPKKPADVPEFAIGLETKIRQKGCQVPAFFLKALQQLKAAPTAEAAAE